MDDVVAMAAFRFPLYNRIRRTASHEDFYGEYAKILMHTGSHLNAGPRRESTDVKLPGKDTFAELHIDIAQYMGSIGWTLEEAERAVRKGGSAMIDLVDFKVRNAPRDLKWKMNLAIHGDGTGRLARVASYTESSASTYGTVVVDNLAAEFGWNNVDWIRDGMLVDIYAVAGITSTSDWTKHAKNVKVSAVSKSGKSFRIDISDESDTFIGTSGTVIADGDFVFLAGSAKINASTTHFEGWNNIMGLHGIIDDAASVGQEFHSGGSNAYNGSWYGATFQGVTRASYAQTKALVRRAGDWGGGTDGTAQSCDLNTVDETIYMIDETGDGDGSVTCMMMNGNTRRWMRTLAAAQLNPFTNVDDGKITPGLVLQGYRTEMGRILPVITVPEMPDGHINLPCEDDLILFEPDGEPGFTTMMGSKVFPSPGRRDGTFESWLRWQGQLGAKACWNHGRIEDIDVAA